MHLDLSREDLDFREEVRAFLEANLTPELRRAGRRATSVFMDKTYSLAWQRILHRRGWSPLPGLSDTAVRDGARCSATSSQRNAPGQGHLRLRPWG